MTILVIGGAGFIGSQVNKQLNQAGYKTVVMDDLSRGNAANVVTGQFFKGSCGVAEDLDKVFASTRFDGVMHFAALTDVGESVAKPLVYYQHNVGYTIELLKAMQRHGVKNFIFSSSAAVYGIPNEIPISENAPCDPINPYGQTKLIVEKILADCSTAYGLRYSALRYFNAAGGDPDGIIKYHPRKENNLIPIVLNNLRNNKLEASVFGNDYPTRDGTCIRDYIHIYDLATAHILALEGLLNGKPSSQYNLGNNQGFSVNEVLHTIQDVTGNTLNIQYQPRRAGDPPILVANAAKAHAELGWQPKYPDINSIVKHAWQAMQN